MEKVSYLKLYESWVKRGKMSCSGLCDRFGRRCGQEIVSPEFELIKPTHEERDELYKEGLNAWLWASGAPTGKYEFYTFTPLRQNIVLLMACLNGEL